MSNLLASKHYVRATHNYDSTEQNEIALQIGMIVEVVKLDER